jgi:hypothetical protein
MIWNAETWLSSGLKWNNWVLTATLVFMTAHRFCRSRRWNICTFVTDTVPYIRVGWGCFRKSAILLFLSLQFLHNRNSLVFVLINRNLPLSSLIELSEHLVLFQPSPHFITFTTYICNGICIHVCWRSISFRCYLALKQATGRLWTMYWKG